MPTDPDSPQVIAARLNEFEAAALIDYLKEQGIKAHAWGANAAVLGGEAGPFENVKVVVRQGDLDRAKTAMEEYQRGDE